MVRIKNWSVVPVTHYASPEMGCALHGEVYGHPYFEDGYEVITSCITGTNGLEIQTRSRTYVLEGPPKPEYADWCESQGHTLDPANPIIFKTK